MKFRIGCILRLEHTFYIYLRWKVKSDHMGLDLLHSVIKVNVEGMSLKDLQRKSETLLLITE